MESAMQKKTFRFLPLIFTLQAVLPGAACQAEAQAEKAPYPAMASVDQYLVPDEDSEIALARTAAPPSISGAAEVMVLGRKAYTTAVKGSNGFLCLVERSWGAATDDPEFWNPKVRSPICFNPPAARTFVPIFLMKTKLVLAGRSKAEIAPAIASALKGVEGAFVMLPAVWAPSPDYREAKGVIANYVEALTKVVPPRVVALSSMGANRTSGLGMIAALSLLEQGFRSLPSPVAFVRAGGFFENFLFGLQAAQGGTLPVFYNPTNRKSTMVATNDIGAEVAKLLTGPAWSGHRVIELGSMASADEVAEQLGEVLKRDVKAFAVPRAGWAEAFEQFGVPKGHTGPAEEMFESVNAGWMDLGITGTEHVAGTTSARDVFAAAQQAVKTKGHSV